MLDDTPGRRPPSPIEPRQIDGADGHILFDAVLGEPPAPGFFEPDHWRGLGAVYAGPPGRAPVCIFSDRGQKMVLRHYYRGGMVARFIRDRYWWQGLDNTRAWREWRLLAALYVQGLPVPRPVAARVRRHGRFYSADLVTAYLDGTESLAERLQRAALPAAGWRRIGRIVREFHERGVFHADLNARNVLLGPGDGVYLVDFDKGTQGPVDARRQLENLERLQRSLQKFGATRPGFHFTIADWRELLAGYRAS